MVGPTSAELESLNELIRFDHVYYKAEPVVSSSKKTKDSDIVSSVVGSPDIVQEIDMSSPVVETEVVEIIDSDCEDVTDNIAIDSQSDTKISNDDTYLDDLSRLAELESLLKQDPVNPTSKTLSSTVTTAIVSKEQSSKYDTVTKSPKKFETPHSPVMYLDSNDLGLTPSPEFFHFDTDMGLGFTKTHSPSFSDSGYSDALSPHSDVSSSLLDDDMWEESFTELFPSLL